VSNFTESVVEDAALAWLEALGYAVLQGPDIAAGEPGRSAATRNTATSCWSGGCARRSCA
jgi:type I restriction enzyme R subunit